MQLVDYLNGVSGSSFTAFEAPIGADLVSIAAAASSKTLKAMLDDVTPVVRPISAQKGDEAPYIVYALDSAAAFNVSSGQVASTIGFDVGLFAETPAELAEMIDAVNTTLTRVEITNVTVDVDRATGAFIGALKVDMTLPSVSGSYPLLLVTETGASANENATDNFVSQLARRDFSITILSDSNNIETLRGELRDQLLGWQETASHFAMEYSSGSLLPMSGGLYAWQETYYDHTHYRQT